MSYILIVDDESEILEIIEMSLQLLTTKPVKSASSGNKALKVIEEEGQPLIIISDFTMADGDGLFLYKSIMERMPEVPFVVCSANPVDQLKAKFPAAFDIIMKPQFLEPLKAVMERRFKSEKATPDFVKVPVGHLLSLGVVEVDGYIRIGEEKYVKVHSRGDVFDQADAERLHKKFLNHLYVLRADAVAMTEKFESFLKRKSASSLLEKGPNEMSYEVLETALAFTKALGWDEKTVSMANATVDLTIKMIGHEKSWAKVLQKNNSGNFYGHHTSLLTVMVTVVAAGIGWTSESTQQKLIFAALMHDHFLDEPEYEILKAKNSDALELKQSAIYKQHPVKVAELARTLKNLPSDVDQILLQHHEYPDGSGFPRGLKASQISPLSSIFIICEELVHYLQDKKITYDTVASFWEENPVFLEKDPFKKIALSMIRGDR